MNPIFAVTANTHAAAMNVSDAVSSLQASGTKDDPGKVAEVSRQFEAILMRQFLSESIPMLQRGQSGQVYGYLLTDSLADTMTRAGGLGLSNILQAQLHT